jgi:phage-related tail fiber protein
MANEFFTILTATGRNKLAAATATGTALTLTQMAVGDGDNGAYYSPTEALTTLKHEVWRGAINHLAVDATNPNWIVAELVIPDNVGGFYIREVGLFDNTGAMIAVGKFPESYKPTLAAGSNKQLYVRMILEVANTSAVTLLVDPSVVLVTRQYCDDKITAEINKLDGKQSVRVATTAAIALSGLLTIDGVALAATDRVLVKNQVVAGENGIYVVAAGNWTRAADADSAIEVTPGIFISVEQGTTNSDSVWQLVTDAPVTLGVTGLMFEMVGGKTGVGSGTYRSVTVNQRGQVTGGTNPTTIAGYGITDATSQVGFQQNVYSAANATGTADAIVATFAPTITALANGMTLNVRASSANTVATPTFTPNNGTIAAKIIVKGNGLALMAGDIAGAGHWIELQYDVTLDKWVLLNPAKGVNPGVSSGQSGYTNLTGSRAISTIYTNTSGRPLHVAITIQTEAIAQSGCRLLVGGAEVSQFYTPTASNVFGYLQGIVPPGATYQVIQASGTNTLALWQEL